MVRACAPAAATIARRPRPRRAANLIDRLRKEIQDRLDQLLTEAEKLRRALLALDPRGDSGRSARRDSKTSTSSASTGSSGAAKRTGARGRSTSAGSRTAASAGAAGARTAPGATKRAVLAALQGGAAMTAGEVAAATGLGRGTVSTTLSKLARNNEVVKAERGYRLPAAAVTDSGSAAAPAAPAATSEGAPADGSADGPGSA